MNFNMLIRNLHFLSTKHIPVRLMKLKCRENKFNLVNKLMNDVMPETDLMPYERAYIKELLLAAQRISACLGYDGVRSSIKENVMGLKDLDGEQKDFFGTNLVLSVLLWSVKDDKKFLMNQIEPDWRTGKYDPYAPVPVLELYEIDKDVFLKNLVDYFKSFVTDMILDEDEATKK